MTLQDLLSIRDRERSALVDRIVEDLESDQRVYAAWLHGSLARDDHDGLSDVDLWVVVSDDHARDFTDGRREHAARAAKPVLVMDNLANAPPHGAYLLVHYAGEVGP